MLERSNSNCLLLLILFNIQLKVYKEVLLSSQPTYVRSLKMYILLVLKVVNLPLAHT